MGALCKSWQIVFFHADNMLYHPQWENVALGSLATVEKAHWGPIAEGGYLFGHHQLDL